MTNVAPRVCAVALAAGVVLSACAQTTAGSPVRVSGNGPINPNAPALSEDKLDQTLLTVSDVSSIVGGSGLQISNSAEDLSDSSDTIDNVECLGVLFAAEKQVYQDSGWKAVRDQIIREPEDNKKHWVEQTVVLFGSGQQAANFFHNSRDEWKKCANTSVTTESSDNTSYEWKLGKVGEPSDSLTTIDMEQQNSNNWVCQHTMGAASNVVVEAIACGHGIADEGKEIVARIVQNARSQ